MKALVVSDAVSEVLYSPEVRSVCAGIDVVLSCGDLPYEYLEYIVTSVDVPLLYVRGNHDGTLLRADGRESRGPEGAESIDGRVVRVRGRGGESLWVAGFGGSAGQGVGGTERTEGEMRRAVRRTTCRVGWNRVRGRGGLDVVVSHAAPRGIHDSEDPCHRGFAAFVELMRRAEPRLWLHGHVHPSYGVDLRPVRYAATDVRAVYGHAVVEVR